MPGIPRSKRCQRCRYQKVKCDENWPSCGSCTRAKVMCSGPPALPQFIHYNNSSFQLPTAQRLVDDYYVASEPLRKARLYEISNLPSQTTIDKNRWTHSIYTLKPLPSPGRNLTTSADRTAARLVRHLTNNETKDVFFQVGYLKFLPARLDHSPALRDCTALMCSSYANYMRSIPADSVVNISLYGRALRNLQHALDNRSNISCETLAAVSLMERFEVLFDVTKPAHRVRHTQGIDGLMRQRGPPDLKNEFDIQLAIENHASLISKWVVEGGDNFYLHPQWKHAMDQAVVHADVPVQRKQVYSVGRYYAYWPSLVHEFQGIYSDGTFLPNAERVLPLWDRVTFLNAEVLAAGELNISSARLLDQIMEKTDTDTESPLGTQFDFANIDTLQLLVTYVMLLIIFNRILYHLSVLSGRPTLSLQENHKDLCHQIWMCIPFMRAMQGMGSILFAAPLYLSYEGATTDSEKKYLLDYIMETAKRSGRYPEDRREVEKFVLNTARSMTGQRPFDTTRFGKSI